MPLNNSPQQIYLSYVHSDETYAKRFSELLERKGIATTSIRDSDTNSEIEAQAESVLTHCRLVVVLVGPKTRDSRWVNLEIALATKPRIGSPSAGLLGIILPEHSDFGMPYYDPENIPVRLHDRVRWEYALARKWIDDPDALQLWLKDAERRRRHFRPEPNYAALQELKSYSWNDNADTPRPALQNLWEQEQ